ncbi:hypothetical protein ACHHYP_13275 [Achlya hypogyna]|uniref:Uncharacterized protein n=1 Tax=Achlya hypogyna TaxID=1202772 RepID=A0A1V9YFR1_ACHHY|nr:hypothetical protein ACHHYP_13275 [Achlya hypogyna]
MDDDGRQATTSEAPLSVFHTRRLLQVIDFPLDNSDETNVIISFASRCVEKKQFQAFYCADKTLLLRSLEEDMHPRFWRVPWTLAFDRISQGLASAVPALAGPPSSSSSFGISLPNPLAFGDEMPFASTSSLPPLSVSSAASTLTHTTTSQQIVALEFSPEGDWLVVVVAWGHKMFLLLIPVAALVSRERKLALQVRPSRPRALTAVLQMHLKDVAPGELMSVAPSPMATQMMSYLRAHGHNGAKYKSTVAGDAEDLSTLEFSTGMTTPTCVQWWRSFNGSNYLLVGSSSDLISIVHVETNQETCRCELSGKVLNMELVREAPSETEARTSLLVTTLKHGQTLYFHVLLETRNGAAVATFPDHFLEDKAFRPSRLKRFEGRSVHVVNDPFARTSAVVVFDAAEQTLTQYADLAGDVAASCTLPALDQLLRESRLVFCSSQLALVQGTTAEDQRLAVWISRPAPVDAAPAQDARVVHTLKLRQDEAIRRVVPGASMETDGVAEMLFFVHTDHQVYECRSKWSRVALFDALVERSIHVQDAVDIGHALGIDMASLCEVVADTICGRAPGKLSRNSCEWIMRLYAQSRVLPAKAVEKLVFHGGLVNAIEYARDVLRRPAPATTADRRLLAHVLVHAALRLLADAGLAVAVTWSWLHDFLASNADYATDVALAACASHAAIDTALHVGHVREATLDALAALQTAGLQLAPAQVVALLDRQHGAALVHPAARGLLRSLPLAAQVRVMCRVPWSLLEQRDWLVRALPELSEADCEAVATALDPRTVSAKPAALRGSPGSLAAYASDVTVSERMAVAAEETVELFLTVLLRLNADGLNGKSPRLATDAFSQVELEQLLRRWSGQYRPPTMVLRCVDYANWAAAAVLYEAHGEWVDAIECKLQLHDLQQRTTPTPSSADELLHLLTTLVVPPPTPELPVATKTSLLARLLIQWHSSGHSLAELEGFLRHPDHDGHVGGLVARLLFTTDVTAAFPERDGAWVKECQALPFSGAFLFHLCESQLPAYDRSGVTQLTTMVLQNIERNCAEISVVALGRQSTLGQDDPIETHAKAFTCGHAYPKRVYDDDVLVVFEKRMAGLPLRATAKVLLDEYRRPGRVEAPCPVCAFGRMQALVATQQKTAAITREPPRARIQTSDQWTWKLP